MDVNNLTLGQQKRPFQTESDISCVGMLDDRWMDGEMSEGGKKDVGTGGRNVLTGPGTLNL